MPTFDGETLIMTLDAPTSGALSQDVQQDWYKEWKLWALNGNLRFPPAFDDNFGGNTLTSAIDAGAYFVFRNDKGWRIRPYEASHTIYVAGNLAPANSLLPVTIPTVGAYTIMFAGLQPVTQNVDKILDEATAANVSIAASTETSKRLVEGLRPHHKGYGDIWYWDPINGSDSNDGVSPGTPCATFAYIHDNLVSDWGHDVVLIASQSATAPIIITETPVITKNWVFVRGAGFNTRFKPTTVPASKAAITIEAEGVQVSGFHVDLINCADPDSIGIKKTGKYFHLSDVIIKRAAKQGLLSINGHDEILENFVFAYNGTDGIEITNTVGKEVEDVTISNGHIDVNGGNGINLTGTAVHEVILRDELLLHGNGGHGLKVGSGAEETHIFPTVIFRDNVLGEIADSGVDTMDSRYTTILPNKVWAKAIEGLTAEEIMRITLAALAGKRQGLGGGVEEYMAQDGITPRITFTPDAQGNGTPILNGAP